MTYAHNAEKSLKKTVESVLNQTYDNLVYYLIDNASTDSTLQIMKEYARKDNRVRVIKNDNSLARLQEFILGMEPCEYFAALDADDIYAPAFAEKMIEFIQKENIDIAMCGICVQKRDGQVLGYYRGNTAVSGKTEIVVNIDKIHGFFRNIWGKVYRMSVVQGMDFSDFNLVADQGVFYGEDTIFCLSAINASDKIGVLDEVLHVYTSDAVSSSYRYNPKRFYVITIWTGVWIKFIGKYEQYLDFIATMYFKEVKEILNILVKSDLNKQGRADEIEKIMRFPLTKSLIGSFPEVRELMEQCLRI